MMPSAPKVWLVSLFAATATCGLVAPSSAESKTNAVFVAQNQSGENEVAAFAQDPRSGRLRLVDTYKTGGTGDTGIDGNQSHALVSNGTFLFVTNSGSNSITSFRIQPGGALRRIGSYSSAGNVPVSLAIKGESLLVANQGADARTLRASVRVFKIRSDGSLSRVRQGHFEFLKDEAPAEILASRSSNVFSVGLSGSNRVDIFMLKRDGSIVRTDTVTDIHSPLGGAVKSSPQTTFVYTLPDSAQPGVVSLYTDRYGKTKQIYQDSREDLEDPCWADIHPNGRDVWLSSFETRALSLYSIDDTGVMRAVSDYVPVTTGPGATDIDVDDNGRYLFRLRGFDVDAPSTPLSPTVDVFAITGSAKNAGLRLIGTSALPDSWGATGTTGIVTVRVAQQ